jgi:hypothetical protein
MNACIKIHNYKRNKPNCIKIILVGLNTFDDKAIYCTPTDRQPRGCEPSTTYKINTKTAGSTGGEQIPATCCFP